jgi:hypothetical protein
MAGTAETPSGAETVINAVRLMNHNIQMDF